MIDGISETMHYRAKWSSFMCHIYSLTHKDFIIKGQTIVYFLQVPYQLSQATTITMFTNNTNNFNLEAALLYISLGLNHNLLQSISSEGIALTVTFFFL